MKRKIDLLLTNCWVELFLRWSLGVIFIYASIHKIIEPAAFAKIVYGYGLLPLYAINLIAIILPYVELISGIALLTGVWPRSASIVINALLFVFIVAITVNLLRGHEFDCGCFSIGKSTHSFSAEGLLVRDIIWFGAGMVVICFRGKRSLCITR